jgi:predicted amidohydrolase
MSTPDLVIQNGLLVDGTGSPPRKADVAITGGKITAIGDDVGVGKQTIDAAGMHRHARLRRHPHATTTARSTWDEEPGALARRTA